MRGSQAMCVCVHVYVLVWQIRNALFSYNTPTHKNIHSHISPQGSVFAKLAQKCCCHGYVYSEAIEDCSVLFIFSVLSTIMCRLISVWVLLICVRIIYCLVKKNLGLGGGVKIKIIFSIKTPLIVYLLHFQPRSYQQNSLVIAPLKLF